MTLRRKGKYSYGDNPDDLPLELARYAKKNEYPIDASSVLVCQACGGKVFSLFSDDDESGALCQCVRCSEKQFVRDSREYMNQDCLGHHECMCGNANFQIAVGLSFYTNTEDVRWVYVGAYCAECGMVGNYIDWNER